MPTHASQQPGSSPRLPVRRGTCATTGSRRVLLAACIGLFVASFLFRVAHAGQTAATPAPAHAQPTAHSPAHARRKLSAAKPTVQFTSSPAAAALPVPAALAAPPPPDWPAKDKPVEATVVWDSHGLFIQASNSSLDQILRDVSLKTGVKVEGMGADQRIFGVYGPGPARDVLGQLLDGSGYNILLVGDQGQGTPRRVVLSGRPNGQPSDKPAPGTVNENDAENDQEAQQEQAQPGEQPRPGMSGFNAAQPVPVRTPEQMLEQRQRQLEQMRQLQQNNPQN